MICDPYNEIRLIVGLGNPGEKYAETRHNAGFMVLDELLGKLRGTFSEKLYHNAILWEGSCKGSKLFVLKPLTFMNASGEAVELIVRKNNISPEEIVLVFDDMDLPLGRIRIRTGGGSSSGHNGVESVQQKLRSADFSRVRVGIGRGESGSQIDHVLSEFTDKEKKIFTQAVKLSADALKLILYRGIGKAMNAYNGHKILS